MRTTDSELLSKIARRDRAAFAELYDRFGTAAFRLARRITVDPQLAEQVVQEAFLAVWGQGLRFDGRRASPSTWLLTITHHKAVDAVRREELRRGETDRWTAEAVDESVDLYRDACSSEQRRELDDALATLSGPHREVIELAYFGGYTQTQLARRLDLPLGTVKSRTHTALVRLHAILEAPGTAAQSPLAA